MGRLSTVDAAQAEEKHRMRCFEMQGGLGRLAIRDDHAHAEPLGPINAIAAQ